MANREQTKVYEPLKEASLGRLHMYRIENSIGEALPDSIGINRSGGTFWIENKYLDEWPKRETTLPLKDAFQRGQLGKIKMWLSWKGHAFVLLRVGKEFILLNGNFKLKEMTKSQLLDEAAIVIGKAEIVTYLEGLR